MKWIHKKHGEDNGVIFQGDLVLTIPTSKTHLTKKSNNSSNKLSKLIKKQFLEPLPMFMDKELMSNFLKIINIL